MRVYSLSNDEHAFLGWEDGGKMLDLTRAIAYYEISRNEYRPFTVEMDELIVDGRFTGRYLLEVMEFVSKKGLADELAVEGDYNIEVPVYPGKIIALGNNYREHIREMGQKIPEEPVLFGKWPSTLIGHGASIVKPSWIGRMDYEAELAVVISRTAKNVPASDAMDYVAGYTCLNDVSARDIQSRDLKRSLPWMPSKNFDTFTPMGPCVLLADAVEEPVEIDVQCRVNGELKQNGNTGDFIFDIPTMIEYISRIMTLEPCDVITTGTPVGVGPLEPGDVVEVTCSGVGTLRNPVAGE